MTDNQEPETPTEESPVDPATAEEVTPKDWMLENIVDIFSGEDDNSRNALSITLQTNGATVSGVLISVGEYLERMGKEFEASPVPDLKVLAEAWWRAMESLTTTAKNRREAGFPPIRRRYIHMKDVRIFSGPSALDFSLWRGTLADVTGWSVGLVGR